MQQQTRRRAAHLDSSAGGGSSVPSRPVSTTATASLEANGSAGHCDPKRGDSGTGGRSLPGRVNRRTSNGSAMPTVRRKRRRRRTTATTLKSFGRRMSRESAFFRMVIIALVLISCGFVGLLVTVTTTSSGLGGSGGGRGLDSAGSQQEYFASGDADTDTVDDSADDVAKNDVVVSKDKVGTGSNKDAVKAKLIAAATERRAAAEEKHLNHRKGVAKENATAAIANGDSGKEDHHVPKHKLARQDLTFKTRLDGAPPCTKLRPDDIAYTLVTQLSFDRLWMMAQHCVRWGFDAPISAVVYTDQSADKVTDLMVKEGCKREQLTVQTLPTKEYGEAEYPVNRMRNMALSGVETSHVMYVDVDFWESHRLRIVLEMPTIREEFAADPKLAAIVPAFQIMRQCKEYRDCREENLEVMPNTTKQMMDLVTDAKAGAFDPTNRGGHGSTSYGAWYMQKEGELYDIPCFKSNRYEPYMAFRYCEDLPPFQEQFTGYGKNKMTWVMQMRRTGWDFSQLGQVFLVHYPHLDSKSRLEWNEGPKEITEPVKEDGNLRRRTPGEVKGVDWGSFQRGQVDQMYVAFRDWLDSDVPDASKVHPCKDATDDDTMLWVDKKQ